MLHSQMHTLTLSVSDSVLYCKLYYNFPLHGYIFVTILVSTKIMLRGIRFNRQLYITINISLCVLFIIQQMFISYYEFLT